jgi:hypothetical protein
MKTCLTFIIVSCWIILIMRNVSTKCVEKIKTRVQKPISRKSCLLWNNVEKCGKLRQATDNIIRRMRFDCWITKATDTHSECVVLTAFPEQWWFRERASMLRLYVRCLSCSYLHSYHQEVDIFLQGQVLKKWIYYWKQDEIRTFFL